jgi:hypothetical protein
MKAVLLHILLASVAFRVYPQTDGYTRLEFLPTSGGRELTCDGSYSFLSNGDSILFETIKFYVSGIELSYKNQLVWKEINSYHLVSAADTGTLSVRLNHKEPVIFDRIKFNIGIDSITNVSGVLGGDLDPTRGMYWSWQSGYINFKLEGKSSQCKTRNNEFQFHLGGYQYPFNTLQTATMATKKQDTIRVTMDLNKLLDGMDLSCQNRVMSPGKESVSLAGKLPGLFHLQP